jgi:NAD(P)-dependent dehydrogenase (short-subunit alcohol dehydrogenase family)
MSLNGKTLFISGASRGIGLAIARRCAADGVNVAIAAKTAEENPKLPGTIYSAAKEIEAAGARDACKTANGRRDLVARQMHDHGLAQHVVELGLDFREHWQGGRAKSQRWKAPPRLSQQSGRCVVADGRISVRIEPRHFAPAPAADIDGRPAAHEPALQIGIKIAWFILCQPFLRVAGGVRIVRGKCAVSGHVRPRCE